MPDFFQAYGLQKVAPGFRLSRKNIGNVLFRLKIRILLNRNLPLNVWRKAFVISLGGKKSGLMHFTTTVN